MRASIVNTALAAVSTLLLSHTVLGQDTSGLTAAEYEGCYSSSYPLQTNSSLTYLYQSSGWCQSQCGQYQGKAAFGLTKGSDCWCGNELPANSTKVSNSKCNTKCQGFGSQMCGGDGYWSVYTSGKTATPQEVPIVDAAAATAAAASDAAASTTTAPTGTQTQAPSVITQAGQTIVITASSSPTPTAKPSSGGGPSKAGIAAGVVAGIVVIAGIAAGVFFFLRRQRRKAVEEEYRREATIRDLKSGGTIRSDTARSQDTRMDPNFHFRRQSDGSIADDTDFSRRVLKVTNPDRAA